MVCYSDFFKAAVSCLEILPSNGFPSSAHANQESVQIGSISLQITAVFSIIMYQLSISQLVLTRDFVRGLFDGFFFCVCVCVPVLRIKSKK